MTKPSAIETLKVSKVTSSALLTRSAMATLAPKRQVSGFKEILRIY